MELRIELWLMIYPIRACVIRGILIFGKYKWGGKTADFVFKNF